MAKCLKKTHNSFFNIQPKHAHAYMRVYIGIILNYALDFGLKNLSQKLLFTKEKTG